MYCTSNMSQNPSSFLTGENSYLSYPPTSISQNILATNTYTSLSSSVGSSPGQSIFSWAHTVPTYMPWAPKHEQGTSEGLPPVVRFIAPAITVPSDPCTSQTATTWELLHNLGNTCSGVHTANQHLKRRSDIDSDDELMNRPVKQYISEEKMAAKLSQMHISADRESQSRKKCSNSSYETRPQNMLHSTWMTPTNLDDASEDSETEEASSTNVEGSLVLSPELKKIIQPNPHLVKALLQENSKPSMALVLWQPPGGSIRERMEAHLQNSSISSTTTSSNENTTTNNNNNTVTSNMNVRSVSSFMPLQFQPAVPCSTVPQCLDETDDMEL